MNQLWITVAVAVTIGVPTGQLPTAERVQATGWRHLESAGRMANHDTSTLVVSSNDRSASLRILCAEPGHTTALLTFHGNAAVPDAALLEVSFDGKPSVYRLRTLPAGILADAVADASRDSHFVIVPSTAELSAVDPLHIRDGAAAIVASVRSSRAMAYNLPSLDGRTRLAAGSFDVRGFSRAAATAFQGSCGA